MCETIVRDMSNFRASIWRKFTHSAVSYILWCSCDSFDTWKTVKILHRRYSRKRQSRQCGSRLDNQSSQHIDKRTIMRDKESYMEPCISLFLCVCLVVCDCTDIYDSTCIKLWWFDVRVHCLWCFLLCVSQNTCVFRTLGTASVSDNGFSGMFA